MGKSKKIALLIFIIFIIFSVFYLFSEFENFGSRRGTCVGSNCKIVKVGDLFNITLSCEAKSEYEWTIQSMNFTMLMFYRNGNINYTSGVSGFFGTEYSECFFEFRAMRLGETNMTFSYCMPDNCDSTTIKDEKFIILMF